MRISEINNNLVLTNIKDFNLDNIFDCGQCFRWNKQNDGAYIGVANSHALKISQKNDTVTLYDTSIEDFNNIWFNYFDFKTNYQEIKEILSNDSVLKSATEFGDGIRILNQDLWECVVSFIISASNNIPRIKKIINTLCELCGDEINYMGETYYSFPTPEKIHSLGISGIEPIKAGFRDKYIISAAEFFMNDFNDAYFELLDYKSAKKELMRINGIGNKVADCILLFALSKRNSFPVDVWIKRVVEHFYFEEEQTIEIIQKFSQEKFGKLGGYAQQYLFYYAREQKIGL
ncbi:MAG: DNA-3-methyladenine glycosylase 2 family protein [Clostridia bacterium]|nr:DNA-3-methyladenine glycosylase 2 family protein [Clostridia bacterium]